MIALTANAMNRERQTRLAAGCDDFATKPIQRLVLLDTVARFVPRDTVSQTS